MLKIFVLICQLCALFLALCMLFKGTRFWEVVHSWMEKHEKVTAVFAVLAMIGIVMAIVNSRG